MDDLIKALQIFRKYTNDDYPTHCEHDTLCVIVEPEKVSNQDIIDLGNLGFHVDFDNGNFYSYRFGSC